jgi:parallel beta-helix repeat protein
MHFRRIVIATFAIVSTAALLTAGPLDPPSGAIAPSYKTLNEVEPRIPITLATAPGDADSHFRITKPGSYYLTDSLAASSTKSAIEIAASNVSIDLNGYTLSSLSNLAVIRLSLADQRNISICNGFIRNSPGAGIDIAPVPLGGLDTVGGIISNVLIEGTTGGGFFLGSRVTVENCTATATGGDGFDAGVGSMFSGCVSSSNAGYGFDFAGAIAVESCIAFSNTSDGMNGSTGSIVNSVATSNTGYGFRFSGATLTSCTATNNGSNGFYLNDSTATQCVANGNDKGFTILSGTVHSCTAENNTTDGIGAAHASVIDSSTNGNGAAGISMSAYCNIRDNRASGNTGPGILVSGSNNTIEGNRSNNNQYGIRVTGTRNLIIRNTCGSNTTNNWSIAIGNSYAQILVAGINNAAVNGNSAAGTIGSTDSTANITY